MRLSIIIPALNEEKLIEQMLSQFTPQLRRQFDAELIVSDGASKDNTVALARPLADVVVEHQSQERQNISQGRNAGAAIAKGETLIFLNADVKLPQNLSLFLNDLMANAELHGAATCKVQVVPEVAHFLDRFVLGICNMCFWTLNHIGMGMGRGECHAVKATIFKELGGYREDLIAGEDFDLFNRIAHLPNVKVKFLWKWTIYEDPRRYRNLGYVKTLFQWFRNFVWISLFNKSYSKEWKDIR